MKKIRVEFHQHFELLRAVARHKRTTTNNKGCLPENVIREDIEEFVIDAIAEKMAKNDPYPKYMNTYRRMLRNEI